MILVIIAIVILVAVALFFLFAGVIHIGSRASSGNSIDAYDTKPESPKDPKQEEGTIEDHRLNDKTDES